MSTCSQIGWLDGHGNYWADSSSSRIVSSSSFFIFTSPSSLSHIHCLSISFLIKQPALLNKGWPLFLAKIEPKLATLQIVPFYFFFFLLLLLALSSQYLSFASISSRAFGPFFLLLEGFEMFLFFFSLLLVRGGIASCVKFFPEFEKVVFRRFSVCG